MKKILIGIFSICLCAICAIGFVGCKKSEYGATTTDLTKVTANGGACTVYNGELYFVNGTLSNNGSNNGGKTLGSIYKVALEDDGSIAENATYTKIVDNLVGFDDGSVTIIGNSLYYVMPGTGKNSRGETLYNKLKFMRKNLDNGNVQEIYTTELNEESEEVSYAYYVANEKVYLVVFENTNKMLRSFTIDNQITTNFTKSKVQSVAFSENLGISENDSAERYVFYTLNCEDNAPDTSTNRVYRVSPDGTNEGLIIDDVSSTLEGIYEGKLIVSASFGTSPNNVTLTYAFDITKDTVNADIVLSNGISKLANPDSYEYVINNNSHDIEAYLTEDGKIAVIYVDNGYISYALYNGDLTEAEKSYSITVSHAPSKFIETYEYEGHTYLVYIDSSDSLVYKIRIDFNDQDDVSLSKPEATKLSTTKAESGSGNMIAKMVNDYVYFFAKDEDSNVLMYRTNFLTPKEINDKKDDTDETKETDESKLVVGAAELVGGKNI